MKISQLIILLLFFVVLLFLVNVLLILLIPKSGQRFGEHSEFDYKFKINKDAYQSIQDLPLDISGQYYLHRNFITSEKVPGFKDLVLVSHCTGNHLHHVVTLSEAWDGPISIAVFVPGHSLEDTLSTLYILYHCFMNVYQRTSIHLAHPVSELPQIDKLMFHIRKAQTSLRCQNALSMIHSKFKDINKKNYGTKIEYPNNLLRNLARHSVNSQYSLVVDVDMKPSQNLYSDFLAFAGRNKLFEKGNSFYDDYSIFVLPAFEADINTTGNLPQNKAQLVTLLENVKVRPFYYGICWKCQKPTDYDRWINLGDVGADINVGYEVKWKDPWEPFFIASRISPDYDERFKQYGFNRISQACELHVAGFKFLVLDRGFVLHQGFKNRDSFHKSKDQENERNKILFRAFKEELKTKYPHSTRRCY